MKTSLYRHFDASGALLYVGISLSALNRLSQHRDNAGWFASIASVTIEHFPDHPAAKLAEKAAIQSEHPRHNSHWQVKPPKPKRFCRGCEREVFNANRVLCIPCRRQKDYEATLAWRRQHPE